MPIQPSVICAFVRCLLLAALLLGSRTGVAQVFAVEVPALPANRLPQLPFRIEKVVDSRADRTILGVVRHGLDNHRVPASFRHSLTTDLLAALQPLPTAAGAPVVVLRVHTLRIAENVRASSEWAVAELQADLLLQQGPDQYLPLQSVSTAAEAGGIDVTKAHGANVAAVLTEALLQLATRPPAPAIAPLSWDDVQAGRGYQPYRFLIQLTRTPRRGIYRTFQEFQADAPSISERPFQVLKQPRPAHQKQWGTQPKIDAQYLAQDGAGQRQPVRGAWGLSDGTDLYIFQRGEYFQLIPTPDGYTFTGVELPDPREMTTAAIAGGLVGTAVVSALANGPADYELSATSGQLLPRPTTDTAFPAPAADSAAVYLYHRSNTKTTAAAAPVTVGGRPVGTLAPNGYLALTWRDLRREMMVCVGATCYSFLPVPGTTTYLAYQPAAPAPTLQPVATKEGVFQLKHIRAREKQPAN